MISLAFLSLGRFWKQINTQILWTPPRVAWIKTASWAYIFLALILPRSYHIHLARITFEASLTEIASLEGPFWYWYCNKPRGSNPAFESQETNSLLFLQKQSTCSSSFDDFCSFLKPNLWLRLPHFGGEFLGLVRSWCYNVLVGSPWRCDLMLAHLGGWEHPSDPPCGHGRSVKVGVWSWDRRSIYWMWFIVVERWRKCEVSYSVWAALWDLSCEI